MLTGPGTKRWLRPGGEKEYGAGFEEVAAAEAEKERRRDDEGEEEVEEEAAEAAAFEELAADPVRACSFYSVRAIGIGG